MDKIMYRDEDIYGSGINDILDVIVYEVYELGNTDILEYCLEHYVEDETLENKINNVIDNLEDYSELQIMELVQDLIIEINFQTKNDLKYCLWLASEQAVKDLYDGSNINALEGKLTESEGDITTKFLDYVVEMGIAEENSEAYNMIWAFATYISTDDLEDFIKTNDYAVEGVFTDEEDIYTPDAAEIRNFIQENMSNEERIKLYNEWNANEISEWNEETETEFWDWLDILDSDDLEEVAKDINFKDE